MATSTAPSLTTYLSRLRTAASKLASLSLVKGLLRIAPGLPAAALAGLVIMFLAWSCEHRARQHEAAEANQVKKQAAEDIARLQQQAAGAVKDAKQSTQAARELEAQQEQLVRQTEGLQQSLESLRKQELASTNEVATLTTLEVAKRVAARLGEEGIGNRERGTGLQTVNPLTRPSPAGVGVGEQGTVNPLTRPSPAGESAVEGHPLPQGGEGKSTPGAEAQSAAEVEVQRSQAALMLTDQGVRKVENAFVQLDSCLQQSQVISQQVSNCEQREKLGSALQEQQAATIAKLNAALADKDQILAQSETAHKAELKAARGTWRTRFYHAVEIFAGGFIVGVLVR